MDDEHAHPDEQGKVGNEAMGLNQGITTSSPCSDLTKKDEHAIHKAEYSPHAEPAANEAATNHAQQDLEGRNQASDVVEMEQEAEQSAQLEPEGAEELLAEAGQEILEEPVEEILEEAVDGDLGGEGLAEEPRVLDINEPEGELAQGGDLEEMVPEEPEELPLEPEEFEELPQNEDEQVYEEQQLDEYGLEYGQDYGHEEQDYGYEVEDPENADFETEFEHLAEHDDDANAAVDEAGLDANATNIDPEQIGDAGPGQQAGREEGSKHNSEEGVNGGENGESGPGAADDGGKDDSKRKHRPISWNDWKGVDDPSNPTEPKTALAEKNDTPNGTKPSAPKTDKPAAADAKSRQKRSRSRSPAKPNSSSKANGTKERERSRSRGSSRGRSKEREKERGRSKERENPSKKAQTDPGRSDPRRAASPPRRSQLMGPGPVIRGRVVPARGQLVGRPVVGPQGRVLTVRRPVTAAPGSVPGRRQSPPPAGYVGRGLVPVVPLRAAPLRAGLPPGEILVPQLAPRRASFPPGRAPPSLETRFLPPPNMPADMTTVRLAAPRDVRDMHIVHVPREQLRDLRTLRPVRDIREVGVPVRAPVGPRGEPVIMKAAPIRSAGPVLRVGGRDAGPVLREPARDGGPMRGGPPPVRHAEYHRLPVPPEMHGRLQGSARQSPPRDERPPMRSASAPITVPRGMDDVARHQRPGASVMPLRRPPSPHRHSPPRMNQPQGGSLRRPPDSLARPHSPAPKRTRHDALSSPNSMPPPPNRQHPNNMHPGPGTMQLSPRGTTFSPSSQRPSASIAMHRVAQPSGNGNRPMSVVQLAPRLPGPPAQQRPVPVQLGRDNVPGTRSAPRDDRGGGRMRDAPIRGHGPSGGLASPRSPPRRDDRREMERREYERREQERREHERRESERREHERRENERVELMRRDHERREQERRESERREQERREQERRDHERREAERREAERRASSQRQPSSNRVTSTVSGRDDGRRPHQQVGSVRPVPHGNGTTSWSRQPQQQPQQQVQQQPLLAQQNSVGRAVQQGGTMMQQLPGPPPVQQQVMGGLATHGQMGLQTLGMQAVPVANANGLMQGAMGWNSAPTQPTGVGMLGGAPQGVFQQMGAAVPQMGVQQNAVVATPKPSGGMGMGRVDETENCWYYIDPQQQKQGPCSIVQFRKWLSYLETEAKYEREYQQFKSVIVWKDGMTNKMPLWTLLQQQGS